MIYITYIYVFNIQNVYTLVINIQFDDIWADFNRELFYNSLILNINLNLVLVYELNPYLMFTQTVRT